MCADGAFDCFSNNTIIKEHSPVIIVNKKFISLQSGICAVIL